ncbi:MAG TPA: TonB-dependent receptor [Bryobacteraceae bacterium]|nr:TonB-dependent receptor [Bryobacteraceae bacterium]
MKASLIAILLAAASLYAQSTRGSIGGQITDAAKKPVTGAAVALVNQETNKKRTAVAGPQGDFLVTLLDPGTYRLQVDAPGYRPHVQDVVLDLDQEIRIEVPLLPGKTTEQVTVSATRSLVRTDSATVGGVIDNRQVQGLPLDGRDFYELSLLLPGVVPAAEGSAASVRGSFAININGAREDSNDFLLDGVFNGDPKLNGVAVSPPVDAVREFEVLSSTYDASFGRNGGAQISVVLRSGSNQFHGTAYEFFRNAVFDARNYFAPSDTPAPQDQRNQFGGTLGGPIVKNRTFFFADYQGTRDSTGITQVTNVPTLAERAGNFSQSSLPAIDPYTGAPFPNNIIPSAYLDPTGLAIAALYPAPNRNVLNQNYVSSPNGRMRDDNFDLRVDHSLAPSSQLTFRYSFADGTLFEPFTGVGFPLVPGYGDNVPTRDQNAMIAETHVFTPALLNEFRAGFDRVSEGVYQQDIGDNVNSQVGLPTISTNPRDFGLSLISVTGFSPVGDEDNNPQHSTSNIYELNDILTWVHGRHQAKFGADFRITQQNAYRDIESRGFIDFLGDITGNALEELLLGLPTDSGVATLDNPEHLRTHSYDFFANDTWRVRPNLTLILGLRYEYNSPGVDAQNHANLYDQTTQTLVPVGTDGMPRGGYLPNRDNFAPRVGFAWTPAGSRTVVRAGYGVYYDQSSLAPGEGLYFSPPYFNLNVYYPLSATAPLLLSNPFPSDFPYPYPPSALAFQRNLHTPYMQQWSFNIERSLGGSRMLEVGYVGSKGTDLIGARDINQPPPSTNPNFERPLPEFADIDLLESNRNSSYNSLQARFEQRLNFGLSLLASYTFAKSIDNDSSFFSSTGDSNFPQDSYDLRAERGLSNFDVRHRFVASYGYDLPFGKATRWLKGWQTFGILQFQTGQPFTVDLLADDDNSNTGIDSLGFGANDRPNVVGNPKLSNPSANEWFNTSAFAIPPYGAFGNSGRNTVAGPGLATVDLSVVKNTAIGDRATAQFRVEAFNVLNRTNFGLPDNFIGSPTFGQILSAGDPRRVQLALKLLF